MTTTTFEYYDTTTAPATLDTVVVPLYQAAHARDLEDPFHTVDRFVDRVRGYMAADGFGMVVALVDGAPAAQAFGYPLPPIARWWRNFTPDEPSPEFTVETGTRTFALNELMTDPRHEGKGVGRAAHNELMRTRSEERATLLVDPDNDRARGIYERLGYSRVGTLHPFPDAPHFVALILPLPMA